VAGAPDLDEGVVERVEFRVPELAVVEAEEVIHDDIPRQGGKGMREVERFLARFMFLHADGEGVDMAVDDVDEVENGPS